MSFAEKVVLITGGSGGIGTTTAELFAKEGATVAIVGRNEAKLNIVAEKCKQFGSSVLVIKADVSKDQDADSIVQKTIDQYGKLDVLVNNAGIFRAAHILSDNFLEIYDEVMNTNIRGLVRITRFAAPHIIETKGNIVNVSSIAGKYIGRAHTIPYNTSKAALNHFSRCVALDLAPYGVRVNSISPGSVSTNIFEGTEIGDDMLTKATYLKRALEPEEVANKILYLASDKARGITGSDFVIDDGSLLC